MWAPQHLLWRQGSNSAQALLAGSQCASPCCRIESCGWATTKALRPGEGAPKTSTNAGRWQSSEGRRWRALGLVLKYDQCTSGGVGENEDPCRASLAAKLGLTERQMEVLALMMEGQSNKAICRALDVAETTVKIHVSAILKALNVANRTQAVIAAAALAKLGEAAAPVAGKASFATPAPVDDAAHPAALFTNKPSMRRRACRRPGAHVCRRRRACRPYAMARSRGMTARPTASPRRRSPSSRPTKRRETAGRSIWRRACAPGGGWRWCRATPPGPRPGR